MSRGEIAYEAASTISAVHELSDDKNLFCSKRGHLPDVYIVRSRIIILRY